MTLDVGVEHAAPRQSVQASIRASCIGGVYLLDQVMSCQSLQATLGCTKINGHQIISRVIPLSTIHECVEPQYATEIDCQLVSHLIEMRWAAKLFSRAIYPDMPVYALQWLVSRQSASHSCATPATTLFSMQTVHLKYIAAGLYLKAS